jgi:hypothetical protein
VSGQLSQVGAQILANKIAGNAVPVLQTSAPTWIPGMDWIDTTSGATLKTWNGSAWIVGAATRYVALLTASPFTSGSGGGYAQTIADLVEVSTTGYSRQVAAWSNAAASYPAPVSNSGVLTFGPMTAAMALAAQWAALVTHAATGTAGLLLYFWQLDAPQQVSVSQSIQVPIGNLSLSES